MGGLKKFKKNLIQGIINFPKHRFFMLLFIFIIVSLIGVIAANVIVRDGGLVVEGSLDVNGDLYVIAEESFCNIVDTGTIDDSFTGRVALDLTIDGRNICEDLGGCNVRLFEYDGDANIYTVAGRSTAYPYPALYRQTIENGNHRFFLFTNSFNGINGDSIETTLMSVDGGAGQIFDDSNTGLIEQDFNQWTIIDNSVTFSFIAMVCDV